MIPLSPIPLSATDALRREQDKCTHTHNRQVQAHDIASVPSLLPRMNQDRGSSYGCPIALGTCEITSQEYQNQKHFP